MCIFYYSYLKNPSYKRKAGTARTIHYRPLTIHCYYIIIKVDIFCCPMPHLDRRSNIKEAYKPNIYDYCCVNEFYSLLDNLTKKIFTVINNWVNFLHPRPYWPKGVEMFSAIVKIVIKNKILLTSWSNNDLVYDIRNIDPSLKKDKFKQEFIYINPNTLSQHKSNISNYPLFIISDILCHNKKNNIDLFQFAF